MRTLAIPEACCPLHHYRSAGNTDGRDIAALNLKSEANLEPICVVLIDEAAEAWSHGNELTAPSVHDHGEPDKIRAEREKEA